MLLKLSKNNISYGKMAQAVNTEMESIKLGLAPNKYYHSSFDRKIEVW